MKVLSFAHQISQSSSEGLIGLVFFGMMIQSFCCWRVANGGFEMPKSK